MTNDCGWSLVEERFELDRCKSYEGLFAQGSGYYHVRGALEEPLPDAPQNLRYWRMPTNVTSERFRESLSKWGTYIPGVFGEHPLLGRELVNLPCFLGLAPIVGGTPLDVVSGNVSGHQRTLDLRTGVLTRSLRWRVQGVDLELTYERFASAAHPHIFFQRLTLTPSADVTLELAATIDGDVTTNGYDHFASLEFHMPERDMLECLLETDVGDGVGIRSRVTCTSEASWRFAAEDRRARLIASISVTAGATVTLEKRTSLATSRDPEQRSADEWLADVSDQSWDEALAANTQTWEQRWSACDVIVDGEPRDQRALRTALYHLQRAHVPADTRVAIDAKGYAGEAYWGRFFWDTEMYLLPVYLYTDPDRARTLVSFRVQSLPGAQQNAARYGYPGAKYAWESDDRGNECCPNWQYADHELHVTADVVYGLAHYAAATNETDWLASTAASVVGETARYWAARVDQRVGDDHPSLLGVMGPDEFVPLAGNNAYTNRLVRFAVQQAVTLGLATSDEERARFTRIANDLPILERSDGLVLQCEEFERLAEPDFERTWLDRTRTYAAQVSQERLYRTKALKQADVLMLMWLFPQEFSDAQVRQAWDYYLPYTTHDSSLSASVHAMVALRLGLQDEAQRCWSRAAYLDLDGGAAEGIHIANAAATWMMAIFGFAGMRTALQADVLTLEPRLPAQWSRLAFPVVWKRQHAFVEIDSRQVSVQNRSGAELPVSVFGRRDTVPARGVQTWEQPS